MQSSTPRILYMRSVAKWAFIAILQIASSLSVARGDATPAASDASLADSHALTKPDIETWLDGLLPYAIQQGDIAGAVVVVVKDGQILAQRGYGYSDVSARAAVDPDTTVFRVGSITKLFTWTAVMQLVEQSKLDLDVDINRYLDFTIPARNGEPITLRNLLTHTPGFEERIKGLDSSLNLPPLANDVKSWTPIRLYRPGNVPAYSNYGAELAGYIVQRVSGLPYADYVDQHILGPLGMARSTVRQPLPPPLQGLMSKGYRLAWEAPQYYEFINPPAGSLATTGADMARFMIAHLQNGTYDGVRILQSATAMQMHAAQSKIYPALNGTTLGFYETDRNGHRVIAHNGGTQFFRSDLHLFLDDDVGLFISLNSNGLDPAAADLHHALFQGFADRYFPARAPLPEPAVDAQTAVADAALVAGDWETSRRSATSFLSLAGLLRSGVLSISANPDGTIAFPMPGHTRSTTWQEISPFVWREMGGQDKLQALVADGNATMLGFDVAPPAALLRIPAWRSPQWLLPSLFVALGVLLLTGLAWPIAAAVRRVYRAPFPIDGMAAIGYRAVRVFSLAAPLTFLAFIVTLTVMGDDVQRFSAATDGWNLTLQGLASVVFVGAAAVSVWDATLVWSGKRRLFAKLWSIAVAISCLLVLYTSIVFHLISFNVNY